MSVLWLLLFMANLIQAKLQLTGKSRLTLQFFTINRNRRTDMRTSKRMYRHNQLQKENIKYCLFQLIIYY